MSRNCLREARHAVEKKKPLTLVHDPVRGGASIEVIKNEECPDDLRAPVFRGREIIPWLRIKVHPNTAI